MPKAKDLRAAANDIIAQEVRLRQADGLDIGYWLELERVLGSCDMYGFVVQILLIEQSYETVHGGHVSAAPRFDLPVPFDPWEIRRAVQAGITQIREAVESDRRWREKREARKASRPAGPEPAGRMGGGQDSGIPARSGPTSRSR